jgi:hypothetical protein
MWQSVGFVVLCLMEVVGAGLCIRGAYREARTANSGLVLAIAGAAIMGFTGIAYNIAAKLLNWQ